MINEGEHPYKLHVKSKDDLKTSYEETRAGFIAFALEKNKRATPYIELARALKVAASSAQTPMELLEIKDIQPSLLTASGVSDKAMKYLDSNHKREAIEGLIKDFLEPAGKEFIDELIYRFILIKGDSLGGSMRNIAGALAQNKLTRSIISQLTIANISYKWMDKKNQWHEQPEDDYGIEDRIKGISWTAGEKNRTLVYNIKVPLVNKNVDLCLFNCSYNQYKTDKVHTRDEKYLLLGELKGGIDPAGADEHWKTANTALSRIRSAFEVKQLVPHTIFIGAAIETSMAQEIWDQLQSRTLSNVANLTSLDQVSSLCRWLIKL